MFFMTSTTPGVVGNFPPVACARMVRMTHDLAERLAAWLEDLGLESHLAEAGLPSFTRDVSGLVQWVDPHTGDPLTAEQLDQLDAVLHSDGSEREYAVPLALVQLARQARVRKALLASPVYSYSSLADLRGESVNTTRFAVHKASEIGRESCRERVCQYAYTAVGAVSL